MSLPFPFDYSNLFLFHFFIILFFVFSLHSSEKTREKKVVILHAGDTILHTGKAIRFLFQRTLFMAYDTCKTEKMRGIGGYFCIFFSLFVHLFSGHRHVKYTLCYLAQGNNRK